MNTRALLNSFQAWAMDYAAQHGLTAQPLANWVTIGPDAIMTTAGVEAFCQQASGCSH
jgi:hypothetical protein